MKRIINLAVIGGGYNSTIGSTHLKSILATGKYKIRCGFFSKDKNKNKKNLILYGLAKDMIEGITPGIIVVSPLVY